ncbi:MAG: caspase family protein [Verrucomicrobiota bacterium]
MTAKKKPAKTNNKPAAGVPAPKPAASGGERHALLVGLTHVDPHWYDGWDGRNGCAGCAIDVMNLDRVLTSKGWSTTHLLDNQATVGAVLERLGTLAARAEAGDSIFFYYSGHGGQERDRNGDESDGQDETLVCYDGQLIDDRLNEIWLSCASGVRLYMISDSCNSQTNYRLAPGNTNGTFPKAKLRAISTAQGVDKGPQQIRAQMLHLGGCRDGSTSMGLADGGVFTKAIVKEMDAGFSGTWKELHRRAADEVSDSQDATISLYPAEGNTMDGEKAFDPGSGTVATAAKKNARPARRDAAAPEVTTDPPAANAGEEMLRRIDRLIAAREAAASTRALSARRGPGTRIVAEGDSWFDFKIRPDVIDWLERDYDYDIENLGKGGACIYEMAYGPEERGMFDFFGKDATELENLVKAIREHKPHVFLFSAGGNDFVGPEFIMTIHHALARKSGVNRGVIDALFKDDVEPGFRMVIETATAAARQAGLGDIPVILHGYDYAFPDGRSAVNLVVKKIGPWMGPSFSMKGYPYENEGDLAVRRRMVSAMIDAVYIMLERLKADYSNIHIVDVRGTLRSRSDWHDELHPTGEGFRRVAALFHQVIENALGRGGGNRGPAMPPGPPGQ